MTFARSPRSTMKSAFFLFIDSAPPVCVSRVRHRRLAVLIELQDLAVVVLRQQQRAIIGADDAVAVVADFLPEELPLLACGDHAGNRLAPCTHGRRAPARERRPRARPAAATAAAATGGGGVLHVAISAA